MEEKSYKKIAAVEKTCAILKFLGNTKEPASAQDIANTTSLALGTTMCHLSTLSDFGFVQRIGDHWRIGTGLALIWARVKSNLEGEKMLIESQIKELDSGSSPE